MDRGKDWWGKKSVGSKKGKRGRQALEKIGARDIFGKGEESSPGKKSESPIGPKSEKRPRTREEGGGGKKKNVG